MCDSSEDYSCGIVISCHPMMPFSPTFNELCGVISFVSYGGVGV